MILESNTAEVKVAFKHSSPFGREIVTSATESRVLVIVEDGTVAISDPLTVNDGVTAISDDIARVALTGEYSAIGDLGGALKERSIIVSAPITVGGETSGAVFSFIPYAGNRYTNENIRFRRSRFIILNRSDAIRYPGCNSCY